MRLVGVLVFIITIAGPVTGLFAQDNLHRQLFNDVDDLMKQAKEKNAEFYAPSSFQQATRCYTDATEEYNRGGKIESINEKVRNASLYLSKALDAC